MALVNGNSGPQMAVLMDARHSADHGYGLAFACADIGLELGYVYGSFAGSAIHNAVDFQWTCWIFAFADLAAIPICFLLRKYDFVQVKVEDKSSLNSGGLLDPGMVSDDFHDIGSTGDNVHHMAFGRNDI